MLYANILTLLPRLSKYSLAWSTTHFRSIPKDHSIPCIPNIPFIKILDTFTIPNCKVAKAKGTNFKKNSPKITRALFIPPHISATHALHRFCCICNCASFVFSLFSNSSCKAIEVSYSSLLDFKAFSSIPLAFAIDRNALFSLISLPSKSSSILLA